MLFRRRAGQNILKGERLPVVWDEGKLLVPQAMSAVGMPLPVLFWIITVPPKSVAFSWPAPEKMREMDSGGFVEQKRAVKMGSFVLLSAWKRIKRL